MFKKTKTQLSRQRSTLQQTGYRRNLSVSSPSLQKAHQQRQVDSKRQQQKAMLSKKHTKRLKLLATVMFVILVALAFRLTLRGTEVTSAQTLSAGDSAKYQAFMSDYLNEHTLAGQSWSLEKTALADQFKKQFPEVEAVRISHNAPFGSTLRADLKFRNPVYIWKDVSKQERFVDKNGVLFAENKMPIKTSELITIDDQSGLVAEAGGTAVSKQTLAFLGVLPGELKLLYPRSKQTLKSVVIPLSTREVRVQPQGVGYYVKFNTGREVARQTGELKTLLAHLKKQGVTPKQYIDIRIANKAFYK